MNEFVGVDPHADQGDAVDPLLLHDFFVLAARQWPDRTAIEVPPGRGRTDRLCMTYVELDHASDALADRLRPFVRGECIIGIRLPRTSAHLYVAQLAVLKSGAAFTCLDTSFPEERVREVLEDAEAVVLLTDRSDVVHPDDPDPIALVDLGIRAARGGEDAAGALPPYPTPASLAYVIYTSGTTGRPKGVMIEHRSIANLVLSDLETFALSAADRVVQGSSPAYDSSIEESWLAFAAGATLLVMDDDAARLGPDLVAWLRDERATVFCPPPTLLRSTGCEDPMQALPELRLLYVGGEALPRAIADRWSQGRALVNGYGPTECAVTCLRGAIEAGQPITIGRPVTGMAAWVLDEALAELGPGEAGELCIGGIGVARGYWKDAGKTAEKFVVHPLFGRIYRTGDLVHRDAGGDFFYHGRIDSQVKLRGYRVELGEIEARLGDCPGVRAAACRVQDNDGRDTLVAFVVPDDWNHPPATEDLKLALATVVPSYMVPAQIGLLATLPTTVGGKLDRAGLPRLDVPDTPSGAPRAGPRSEMECLIETAVSDILQRPDGVSIEADFFEDLGGDSLSAAMLVTLLRQDPATSWVTVSDIYEARTVAALARRARNADESEPAHADAEAEGTERPALVTGLQTAWLIGLLYGGSLGVWFVSFELLPRLLGGLGLVSFILLAPLLSLAAFAIYAPLSVLFAVVVKRVLIGRYRPIRAPVWGMFYLRNWIVQQSVRLVPWRVLEGTVFQQTVLRALGARIGKRVHIHRGVDLRRGGWDLLDIGDDVTISQDALVRLVELDRSHVVIGPIALGNGATLDTRAGLAPHSGLGAGARLTALSSLPSGGHIPAGELWDGVAARPIGRVPPAPSPTHAARTLSPWQHGLILLLAEAGLELLIALPIEAATILLCMAFHLRAEAVWRWIYHPTSNWRLWTMGLGLAVVTVPLTLAWTAILARLSGPVREGVISRWSLGYVRVWLKTSLLNSASEWLSGTLFWPYWLRGAGMRIGRNSEISTILDVVPELVEIGGGTFFADGIYLGGPRIHQGSVSLATTRIGDNTFLGNHVVIESGQKLPDDILIGISTPANAAQIRPGTSWFGHPSFELPRREVVEVDRSLTHEPSVIRYWNRVFWEALRFALPIGPLLATILWFQLLALGSTAVSLPVYLALVVPVTTFAVSALLCLSILAMKWALLGRVKPGQHALWSCWCSRWDFLYVAWGKYARTILESFEGTLMLLVYLRAMGMKLGKRVVLGPGFAQVVDPDMIEIGDGATVNAIFQVHTFEDRVLKIDRATIGKGATLAAATVPLYGARIGERTYVGPHSVIMKQELLLPGVRYEGAPTRTLGAARGG